MVVVELGAGLSIASSSALFPCLDAYTVSEIFSNLTLSEVICVASTCRSLYSKSRDFRRIEGVFVHVRLLLSELPHFRELRVLDLASSGLGLGKVWGSGPIALAKALTDGGLPMLAVLNLSKNYIGAAGATELAKAFQAGACPSLMHLDLSSNGIYSEGTRQLALAFASGVCPLLESLALCSNGLGAQGMVELAKAVRCGWGMNLRSLSLNSNCLGPMGLKALLQALEGHHHDHNQGAAAMSPRLLPRLEALNLFLNELQNEGASSLASSLCRGGVPSLRYLDLSANRIGQPGVEQMSMAVQRRGNKVSSSSSSSRRRPVAPALEVVDLSFNLLPWEKHRWRQCPTFKL